MPHDNHNDDHHLDDHHLLPSEPQLKVKALETILTRKGLAILLPLIQLLISTVLK